MNNKILPHELYRLIAEAVEQDDCLQALCFCQELLQIVADPRVDVLRKNLKNKIKDQNINENIRQFTAAYQPPLPPRESRFRPEVLIPCFNQGRLLTDALASLPDGVAVTVINDASTDDTADHIDALSLKHAFNSLTNTVNLNQSGSLNRAIALSDSNLFIILNADDALVRYAIPAVIEVLTQQPMVRMVGGDCCPFDNAAVLALNRELPAKLPYCPQPRIFSPADALAFQHPNDINMTMSGCSFLRSAWEAVAGFRDFEQRVCSFDDRDFQMRVCALFPVAVLQETLAFYRVNSSVGRGRSL
jgi:GT2 family glycosyltransferase